LSTARSYELFCSGNASLETDVPPLVTFDILSGERSATRERLPDWLDFE
jgi:hypothetical protein